MYKKILVIASITISTFLFYSFLKVKNLNIDTTVKFIENNWEKTKEESRKQNRLIFLDAYTTWCGPCKQLKAKTFTDKSVGEFFNANFINAAIDIESGDGPEIAKRYSITAIPTLLILDSTGKVLTYTKGFLSAEQILQFAKYGLSKK